LGLQKCRRLGDANTKREEEGSGEATAAAAGRRKKQVPITGWLLA